MKFKESHVVQERFTGGGKGVRAGIRDGRVYVGVGGKGTGLICQPMPRIITKPQRLYMDAPLPKCHFLHTADPVLL